jgi:hypothetical protein
MVLNINNRSPHNLSSSSSSSATDCDDDDDNWEMVDDVHDVVGGGDDGQHPLQHQEDDTHDLELEVESTEDREQRVEQGRDNNEDDDAASIAVGSAVSSITGECHATVSDVGDDDDDDDDDGVGKLRGGLDMGAKTSNVTTETAEERAEEYDENILRIIEQLANMGFAMEQILKAIRELRNVGGGGAANEIEADSIIDTMLGEEPATATTGNNDEGSNYQPTHPLQLPIECTLEYLNSTMQEIKDQHQELRHRAKNCVENVSRSARDIWTNVLKEKDDALQMLRRRSNNNSNNNRHCAPTYVNTTSDGDHEPSSASSNQQTRYAATPPPPSAATTTRTTILESIRRANDEHHLAEKFAAIAVVGSATLLALGHPRASLGAVAVAGASLAVGEGMVRQQQQRDDEEMHFHHHSSTSSTMRDYGLAREDLHLD